MEKEVSLSNTHCKLTKTLYLSTLSYITYGCGVFFFQNVTIQEIHADKYKTTFH